LKLPAIKKDIDKEDLLEEGAQAFPNRYRKKKTKLYIPKIRTN
jgi:hypothetical protein